MSVETKTWRVGIVGASAGGLFLAERLSLQPSIELCGAFDSNPERLSLLASSKCQQWSRLESAVTSTGIDALIFSGDYSEDDVVQALKHRLHVVLDRPWQLSAAALRRIDTLADTCERTASVACPGRSSMTFLGASAAMARVGALHSVRFVSCEQSILCDESDRGALREFGCDRIDELLQLVNSKPVHVTARQSFDSKSGIDQGFLATIEFANGCIAHTEIQTQSRLSYRTGWMLEGAQASFRNNRLYTTAADGEIIDEPFSFAGMSGDPLIEELIATWEGRASTRLSASSAAAVMDVIETIQLAASSFS